MIFLVHSPLYVADDNIYNQKQVMDFLHAEKVTNSWLSLNESQIPIALGLHQSENIQTPSLRSLNLKESNKNRRRSGAHSHSGHIPSQVNLIPSSFWG